MIDPMLHSINNRLIYRNELFIYLNFYQWSNSQKITDIEYISAVQEAYKGRALTNGFEDETTN